MSIKEVHGVKGSIILNHDWYEDSQGIGEYYNQCARLDADTKDDSFVLMTLEDGKADFRKGVRQSTRLIKISAKDLISLIDKYGSLETQQ